MNIDPREVGPKPPFPRQEQTHPGTVKKLNPPADHGEDSYVGTGELKELKPGASILNTTSIQADQPGENLVAYAATKAAVLSMTKSVAKLAMEQLQLIGFRVTARTSRWKTERTLPVPESVDDGREGLMGALLDRTADPTGSGPDSRIENRSS